MKALVGSTNQVKINGAKKALEKYYSNISIEGVKVSSDVSDEPVNEEIYMGAKNRINNLINYAKENNLDVDYFLTIESGITNLLGDYIIINVALISDKEGNISMGTSAGFPVSNKYLDEIISTDLNKVITKLFTPNEEASREGAISYLTKNVITRTHLTEEAFIMALTKFKIQLLIIVVFSYINFIKLSGLASLYIISSR